MGSALFFSPVPTSQISKNRPLASALQLAASHFLLHSSLRPPQTTWKNCSKVICCYRTKPILFPVCYLIGGRNIIFIPFLLLGLHVSSGRAYSLSPRHAGTLGSPCGSFQSCLLSRGLHTQLSSGARQVNWVWDEAGVGDDDDGNGRDSENTVVDVRRRELWLWPIISLFPRKRMAEKKKGKTSEFQSFHAWKSRYLY